MGKLWSSEEARASQVSNILKQRTESARVDTIKNKTVHSYPRAKTRDLQWNREHGILLSFYLYCKACRLMDVGIAAIIPHTPKARFRF